MKILVTSLPDLKKINFQRPHQIIKYLSDKHDVTVVCVNAKLEKPVNDPLVEECLKKTVFYYLSEKPIRPIFQELRVLKKIPKISDKNEPFDIHLNFHGILSCYLIQKRLKVPTVLDVCDDIVGWISHTPQINPIIRPFVAQTSKYLLISNIKKSKKVIFSVKSLQKLYGISDGKSEIIPNGVDVDFFFQKSKEKSRNEDDFFTIGFVGFLGDWVDFSSVFTSVAQMKATMKLKILIVGDGPNLGKIQKFADDSDLAEQVGFVGNVPYSEIPEKISQMDVCILPFNDSSVSQHALPLKLFEYMASNKPVISSRIEAVEQTIGDKILYYSDPGEFRTSLENLYYDKKMAADMSIKGMKFVRDEYSWNSILYVYEKVLIDVYKQRGQ